MRTLVPLCAIPWQSGKEEKKLKSEPIPAKNDEPVTVLVGNNFEELVLKSKKNGTPKVAPFWA